MLDLPQIDGNQILGLLLGLALLANMIVAAVAGLESLRYGVHGHGGLRGVPWPRYAVPVVPAIES